MVQCDPGSEHGSVLTTYVLGLFPIEMGNSSAQVTLTGKSFKRISYSILYIVARHYAIDPRVRSEETCRT
jgi:hypothetical protein